MVGINEGALESPFGIDGGKLVRKNSISIEANLENSDPKSQKGVLHLTVSGETYQDTKKDIVKNMIKGKSFSEAKQLLESQSSIDIVIVNAKPFIVGSKITNDPSKIEIEIVQ
jgi:hypothetical protein